MTTEVDNADALLQPLPPPPRPRARPSVRGAFASSSLSLAAHARPRRVSGASAAFADESDDIVIAPQHSAPQPHAHPLAALAGGDSGWQRNRPPLAKRLHPAFLNPERVAAFLEKENADPSAGDDALGAPTAAEDEAGDVAAPQLLSTRFLERRIRDVAAENAPLAAELDEDEKVRAATDASHWRHELHPLPLPSSTMTARGEDSALERARVRRVRKQVDPKWLRRQRDAANRPLAPLERDDERHLREQLVTTSVDELVASGVLFDDDDAKRLAVFDPVLRPTLPIYSSGTTGLPGCCYDAWSL